MRRITMQALPPDQNARDRALDPARSILVQAPAGSGKTTLLTERFLTLLATVDEPSEVVAITFTNAAAAEMRNRILDQLRGAEPSPLAQQALDHSQVRGWKLLDLPAQLRIMTIDSFCRELALQQPLLSGLGGGLQIAEQPTELYRRAARGTMREIGRPGSPVYEALEHLLNWRDNGWQELEDLLVVMLDKRQKWMQDFVLSRDPDWEGLRARLERPFAAAVREGLERVSWLLDQLEGVREEALRLARFACEEAGEKSPWRLAERAAIPTAPFCEGTDDAQDAFKELASFLQTESGTWRSVKGLSTAGGFPSTPRGRQGKAEFGSLIARLSSIPGLELSLAAVPSLPPARYPEEDWQVVRACFTLLRHAAGQLKVVFAEAGRVDFVEVAQIAESVLRDEDGSPSDAAIAVAGGIRHLLVDEFQDTSRHQHQMLASLIGAWDDRNGCTLFAVGDPMQSIYFFRDADAELFARVKQMGLEIPNEEPFMLDAVELKANFRTTPALVETLNDVFGKVFAEDDGSGIRFSEAEPARDRGRVEGEPLRLNVAFVPYRAGWKRLTSGEQEEMQAVKALQLEQIVELIRVRQERIDAAKATGGKFRIAVLGRGRKELVPIAAALRQASIPFRAVDLEQLGDRQEVLDALALSRALLNREDRVAWLGVLRAPWCGLTLGDLHQLTSADDRALLARTVPELLADRRGFLSSEGKIAADRVLAAMAQAPRLRAAFPTASAGTVLEQIWLGLGGADCCDRTARANLDLLWKCLDQLPSGERDLLGPVLEAALDKLTALPDPGASNECGVQLMTIHKSKGMEFEVVIVPDLQAKTRGGSKGLLSWLERGVKPDVANSESEGGSAQNASITEFLVAPLPSKGAESGHAKRWVDSVYRERESQETRRILYVAATRTCEELHLFAQAAYKKAKGTGELSLADPGESLWKTAWPGLETAVRATFETWKAAREKAPVNAESLGEIESIAAAGNLVEFPVARPTLLRRLPADYAPPLPALADARGADGQGDGSPARLYARHEGGAVSRALGRAVHTLFEELARLQPMTDWEAASSALRRFEPLIAAQVRTCGLAPVRAKHVAAEALELVLAAAADPAARWILASHRAAENEVSWTGVTGGKLTSVRIDRVFRAGLEPFQEGEAAWWIVDYKTAHAIHADPAIALPALRREFSPQLEVYARVLRNLHGGDAVIRAGLYYPRMPALDWWEL